MGRKVKPSQLLIEKVALRRRLAAALIALLAVLAVVVLAVWTDADELAPTIGALILLAMRKVRIRAGAPFLAWSAAHAWRKRPPPLPRAWRKRPPLALEDLEGRLRCRVLEPC